MQSTKSDLSEVEQLREETLRSMAEKAHATGIPVTIPPPFVATLGMRVVAFEPPRRLVVTFPFNAQLTNPLGILLGGMVPAYVDAAMGPLTYVAMGRPCLTTEMSTTFIRPITPDMKEFTVDVTVTDKTRRFVIIEGKVRSPDDKLLAVSRTTSIIVEESRSK